MGDGLTELLKVGERSQQQREFLEKSGTPHELIDTLMSAQGDKVKDFIDKLEVPPEDLQELLKICPDLITNRPMAGTNQDTNLNNLTDMLQAGGIKGTDVRKLLESLVAGEADKNLAMSLKLNELNTLIDDICKNTIPNEQGKQGIPFVPQSSEDWSKVVGHLQQRLGDKHKAFLDELKSRIDGQVQIAKGMNDPNYYRPGI